MERLRFIERSAFWRGIINRQDLVKVFGLSMAQASSDLQKYQQTNPGALVYNMNKKRYEGAEGMVPNCTVPNLEEAMTLFLVGGGEAKTAANMETLGLRATSEAAQVYIVKVPARRASAEVERRVFLAVINGLRIRVRYYSVNSGTDGWRWIQPSAFAHDGNRWHVRAWCETNERWSDFNLSRIAAAEWPTAKATETAEDTKRKTLVTLKLRPNSKRSDPSPAATKAVELDFGMTEGVLEIQTTEAEVDYLRGRLGVPLSNGKVPEALVELVE
jgi:hypothetical protein